MFGQALKHSRVYLDRPPPAPLDDVDLGGQIARNLKTYCLLMNLRLIPDFHRILLRLERRFAPIAIKDVSNIHLKRQSSLRVAKPELVRADDELH